MSAIQHQELRANRFVRIHEGPTAVSATLGSTSSLMTKAVNQKVQVTLNILTVFVFPELIHLVYHRFQVSLCFLHPCNLSS